MNLREFTERCGDPAKFVFNGQYYDAGLQSKTKCTACGQEVHLVYVLKNDRNRSVPFSSCCFVYFKQWNPKVHTQLCAAAVLLGATIDAEARDKKIFAPQMEVRERRETWRGMKRKALDIIREYKVKTGKEWLPEQLFDLKVVAEQTPAEFKRVANAIRWYERQTATLESKLQNVSL